MPTLGGSFGYGGYTGAGKLEDPNKLRMPGAPVGPPGMPSMPVPKQSALAVGPAVNTGPVGRPPISMSAGAAGEPGAPPAGAPPAGAPPTGAPPTNDIDGAKAPIGITTRRRPVAVAPSIADQMAGFEGPYSKAIMAQMDEGLMSAMRGQVAQGRRSIDSDAARRGLFRSGVPVSAGANLERGAMADYSGKSRKAAMDAYLANYGAKSERQRQLEEDVLKREDMANQLQAARIGRGGGGGGEPMVNLQNPDGTTSSIPASVLQMLSGMS